MLIIIIPITMIVIKILLITGQIFTNYYDLQSTSRPKCYTCQVMKLKQTNVEFGVLTSCGAFFLRGIGPEQVL